MGRIYLNENYNIKVGRKSGEIYLTIWGAGMGEAAYRNWFSATVQSKISDQVWERRVISENLWSFLLKWKNWFHMWPMRTSQLNYQNGAAIHNIKVSVQWCAYTIHDRNEDRLQMIIAAINGGKNDGTQFQMQRMQEIFRLWCRKNFVSAEARTSSFWKEYNLPRMWDSKHGRSRIVRIWTNPTGSGAFLIAVMERFICGIAWLRVSGSTPSALRPSPALRLTS